MPLLEVKELAVRYDKAAILNGVSLRVEEGEFVGLVGPNGAGKSTLVRMLATIVRPTKGRITVDGRDAIRRAAQVRRWLGYVPDVYALYDDTKVWEYLGFFARCYDMPARMRSAAHTPPPSGVSSRMRPKRWSSMRQAVSASRRVWRRTPANDETMWSSDVPAG